MPPLAYNKDVLKDNMTQKNDNSSDDNKANSKGTLSVSRPSKLSLTKTVESGKVKQNFTHGRSKSVTVEVKRTRTFTRGDDGKMGAGVEEKKPVDLGVDLSSIDMGASFNTVRDKNQMRKATSAVVTTEEKQIQEAEDAARKAAVEQARVDAEEVHEATVSEAEQAVDAPVIVADKVPSSQGRVKGAVPKIIVAADEEEAAARKKAAAAAATPKPGKMKLKPDNNRRSSSKLTVTKALDFQEERMRSLASIKRQREKVKRAELGSGGTEKVVREVTIPEIITVQDLANRMAERANDVIRILMKMGTMATLSQSIDADTAELVVMELGHKPKRVTEADVENVLVIEPDSEESLQPRPPVVTIMGHVDHGKTSLLDALREANVVSGEAGGITQHIGAYQVVMNERKITFLDTPGHEAFTAMRSRGAKVTDIVVLVVAADDGIKAQTVEAINHAKAAEVGIIVAINKIDKPGADSARVKMELMQHNLLAEEFGGQIQVVEVSAKQRLNLDGLVEAIQLQADMLELTANPNRRAAGVVVEASMDKGRGVVATVLVQKGTLAIGDIIVAGSSWGKVRAMVDERGRQHKEAIPSQPIEVLGFSDAPMAGDEVSVVENEKIARDIVEYRQKMERDKRAVVGAKTLEQMFASASAGAMKELPVVVKGDVQGSVEAIVGSLAKFDSDEVSVKITHTGVGAISESDISLAHATGSIIVGFNVRAMGKARQLAEHEGVDIRYYSVIYDLVDDVRMALSGLLSPERRENITGYSEIRQVFNITKTGKVAGCMVTEGIIRRGSGVRLLRDNVVIHEGTLKTLKRFKDEVKEVKSGFECGMAFERYDDIREGDMIEAYEIEEIVRTVEASR